MKYLPCFSDLVSVPGFLLSALSWPFKEQTKPLLSVLCCFEAEPDQTTTSDWVCVLLWECCELSVVLTRELINEKGSTEQVCL